MKRCNRERRHPFERHAPGLYLLMAMLVVFGVVACGGGSSQSSSKTLLQAFVFAPPAFNDPTKLVAGAFDAAQSEFPNITLEQHSPSQLDMDAASYLSLIKTAIIKHPYGILVFPNVGAALSDGLEQIAKQGIKVMLIDQDISSLQDKLGFVGPDNFRAGQDAAKWLIQQYNQGQLKSNEVGVLRSSPGVVGPDLRLAGFQDAIKDSPLKLVSVIGPSESGGFDVAHARTAMTDMLTAHPNLGGVFTVQDAIAEGAGRTLVDSNRTDVKLISIDGDRPAIQMILQNQGVSATLAQPFFQETKQAVELMVGSINGHSVPKQTITLNTLVTRDNANQYLDTLKQQEGKYFGS